MNQEWTIRRVRAEDEEQLVAFAKRMWPRQDARTFVHRFWMNATPPQCFGAFAHNESIGGVCAAREQRVFVAGVPANAVGICDWFVDATTRGTGLGRKLADAALREAQVGWAFSVSAGAEKAFLKLGFSPELRVLMFLTPSALVAARNALPFRGGLTVETRNFSHADVDSIAGELEQARGFRQDAHFTGGARDVDAWRSHLKLMPSRIYQAHILRNRQAELVALAVSRRLRRGAFPRLGPTRLTLVSELLCDLRNRELLQPLFRRVAFDALSSGSELLVLPMYDPPMHDVLARAGFFSSAASWLGLRIPRLSTRVMIRQRIAPDVEPSDWRVTAFDCDFDLEFGAEAER